MKQQIKSTREYAGTLEIELTDPGALDPSLLEHIRHDDLCITPSFDMDRTLRYPYEGKVPLQHFLEQYTFGNLEGYDFLIGLFENAIAANRTKPVLLDLKTIFVQRDGTSLSFVVVPLKMDYWLYQKEEIAEFVRSLLSVFHTDDTYEIAGYMLACLLSPEFSLTNLVLGLKALRKKYHPPKWYARFAGREAVQFRAAEEVGAYICEPVCEPVPAAPSREDKIIHTQIIGMVNAENPYLLSEDGQRYDILFEQMTVGRAMSCDIRLEHPDVSLRHARLTKTDGRCYIQDLRSSNGTYLGEKRVQRKMRLKEGMTVLFGQNPYTFHE